MGKISPLNFSMGSILLARVDQSINCGAMSSDYHLGEHYGVVVNMLDANISIQEDFIHATLDAERDYSLWTHSIDVTARPLPKHPTLLFDRRPHVPTLADKDTFPLQLSTHPGRRRHKNKNVKIATENKPLSFGHDILWGNVVSLQNQDLDGRWVFSSVRDMDMADWISTRWSPILGHTLKVSKLMNSWYSFHFLHRDDSNRI